MTGKIKQLFILPLFILSLINRGVAQEKEQQNLNFWMSFQNRFRISSNFYYIDDISYRHTLFPDKWRRILYNPSIAYNATNNIQLYLGLGNYYTFQEDLHDTYELRPWQSIKFHWPKLSRLYFDHTLKLEERFINDVYEHLWKMNFRARYRLNIRIPINKTAFVDNTFYTAANVEAYTNIGKSIPEKYVNLARFGISLGYRKNEKWLFELIYMIDQSKEYREDNFEINNHIIRLRIRNFISI